MRGRRLPEAYSFAVSVFDAGLVECNSWTTARWDVGLADLLALQGCVRGTIVLGRKKLEFLTKLPFLLTRLRCPGVRDECVRQWNSAPARVHHALSALFMDPGGRLRGELDDMSAAGDNIAAELDAELRSIEMCPMDDSVCEGPHAVAEKVSIIKKILRSLVDVRLG